MKNQHASKVVFPIAIEPGDEGHAFGVVVPDLPGCFSAGGTLEEALLNAKEAIIFHMEGMIEEGLDWHGKKSLDEHRSNPDFSGWVWALVEVDDIRETHLSTRVNITLPKGLLSNIDQLATTHRMTRSGFLADAARKMINARSG